MSYYSSRKVTKHCHRQIIFPTGFQFCWQDAARVCPVPWFISWNISIQPAWWLWCWVTAPDLGDDPQTAMLQQLQQQQGSRQPRLPMQIEDVLKLDGWSQLQRFSCFSSNFSFLSPAVWLPQFKFRFANEYELAATWHWNNTNQHECQWINLNLCCQWRWLETYFLSARSMPFPIPEHRTGYPHFYVHWSPTICRLALLAVSKAKFPRI